MKALKYTPKVALKQRALGSIVRQAAELLAERFKDEGEEIPSSAIKDDLWEFCVLSTRAEFEEREIDFEPAKANETPETLAVKYVLFLGSEKSAVIQEAWKNIFTLDLEIPSDPALGPVTPDENDPKVSSAGQTGS